MSKKCFWIIIVGVCFITIMTVIVLLVFLKKPKIQNLKQEQRKQEKKVDKVSTWKAIIKKWETHEPLQQPQHQQQQQQLRHQPQQQQLQHQPQQQQLQHQPQQQQPQQQQLQQYQQQLQQYQPQEEEISEQKSRPIIRQFFIPQEEEEEEEEKEKQEEKKENEIISEFNIVSYNVRVDVDPAPHSWNYRKSYVLKNMTQFSPSIICLQEATPKVIEYMKQQLPNFNIINTWRNIHSQESSPIIYNTKIWTLKGSKSYLMTGGGLKRCDTHACVGETTFGKGFTAKYPRIMTHAILQNGNTVVNVLNTHYPLASDIQKKCSEVVAKYIHSTLQGQPIVLCGDFNSYDGAAGEIITHLLESTGLQDAHNLNDTPTFGTFKGHFKRGSHKLDYILYRELTPTASSISDFRYGSQNFRPSDHSCIVATFKT